MLVLGSTQISELLLGQETDVVAAVRDAYIAHAEGLSVLPHSSFLRLPEGNRIIALPAYLHAPQPRAGMKWIASFPGNIRTGMNRASAVIILNSPGTGQPEAVLEGSVISAQRTAASAALAASTLHSSGKDTVLGIIGCGVINFEVVKFMSSTHPGLTAIRSFDLDAARAQVFNDRCRRRFPDLDIMAADTIEEAITASSVVSIATTAQHPHIQRLPEDGRQRLILHLSLRDLTAELITGCHNIVDDADHVCREQTSLHLAEHMTGDRSFISSTLADFLLGGEPPAQAGGPPTVFSPFGLGILDLAVAGIVTDLARQKGLGVTISDFSPRREDV